MAYASIDDVEVSLGRDLTSAEAVTADSQLDRVENRIRVRIPDLDAQVAVDTYMSLLIEVEAEVVARFLRNPDGYLQEQEGDYAYTRDRRVASGAIGLTDEEWARLGVTKGAFTIAPYIEADPVPSDDQVWVTPSSWTLP